MTAGVFDCSRRASNRTRLLLRMRISAVSSMRTMRSSSGIKSARMLSKVVFPVPVPPLIKMFCRLLDFCLKRLGQFPVERPQGNQIVDREMSGCRISGW